MTRKTSFIKPKAIIKCVLLNDANEISFIICQTNNLH